MDVLLFDAKVACRRFALECGAVVFSIGYRLAPENPYPMPMNDAWDSFTYISENLASFVPRLAAENGAILVGTSAGGLLAALVSQRARDHCAGHGSSPSGPNILDVKGVLLRNPVTVYAADDDFIPPKFRVAHRSWAEEFETPLLSRESMKVTYGKAVLLG